MESLVHVALSYQHLKRFSIKKFSLAMFIMVSHEIPSSQYSCMRESVSVYRAWSACRYAYVSMLGMLCLISYCFDQTFEPNWISMYKQYILTVAVATTITPHDF